MRTPHLLAGFGLLALAGLSTAGSGESWVTGGTKPQPPAPKPTEAVTETVQEGVRMQLRLDRSKVRPGADDLFAVTTLEVIGGVRPDRKPLALSVVLDVSGSMEGEKKLHHVVEATKYVVDRLGKDDRVSIVAYETGTHTVYVPDGAPDAEAARRALEKLRPLGGTNMEAGLRLGLKNLAGLGVEGAAKRLLLLSDGQANQGISSIEGLSKIAASVREMGGSVSTFGVGADYNEDLMAKVAEAAGGNYHVIDRGAQLAEVFSKEFSELGSLVGNQVRLKLDLPEGLEVAEAYGYPLENGEVVLRDLYFGMKTKVVLRLKVKEDAPTSGKARLAQFLSYHDVEVEADRRVTAEASFEWTSDAAAEKASANPAVVAIAEEVRGAQELDAASRAYASGDEKKAKKLLRDRMARNEAMMEGLAEEDAERLEVQNQSMQRAMDMFKAPASSRAGKAAVKWSKQESRMQNY